MGKAKLKTGDIIKLYDNPHYIFEIVLPLGSKDYAIRNLFSDEKTISNYYVHETMLATNKDIENAFSYFLKKHLIENYIKNL